MFAMKSENGGLHSQMSLPHALLQSMMLIQHAEAKHAKLPVTQCWPQIEEMKAKEASG